MLYICASDFNIELHCSGYMSPEYALRGHYTTKLDVFSFGALVLEIVTGRRNNYAVNSEDLFSLVSTYLALCSVNAWILNN